jgi:NADH dehydrogenase [ubiquinone] 1 alpha subcomplex assembly factor 1
MKTALTASLVLFGSATAYALLSPPDRLGLVPDRILFGFSEEKAGDRWVTVNDNVMGGRSRGGFTIGEGRLSFEGNTNTNGGGFSSIRTRRSAEGMDLSDADGLLLRVDGDGREYIVSIETDVRMGSYAVGYWAKFKTGGSGNDETVRIPFDAFYPTFFGEDISGRAPELDLSAVSSLGLYIYDKKDGPFALDVEWIGTYQDTGAFASTEAAGSAAASGETRVTSARMLAMPVPQRAMAVIERAIELGVPRFNNGDHGGCADIYEVAITSLLARPEGMPDRAVAALDGGLEAGHTVRSQAERAWAYRRAMDVAYAALMPMPGMSARAGD